MILVDPFQLRIFFDSLICYQMQSTAKTRAFLLPSSNYLIILSNRQRGRNKMTKLFNQFWQFLFVLYILLAVAGERSPVNSLAGISEREISD